jgi:hypothetical protein
MATLSSAGLTTDILVHHGPQTNCPRFSFTSEAAVDSCDPCRSWGYTRPQGCGIHCGDGRHRPSHMRFRRRFTSLHLYDSDQAILAALGEREKPFPSMRDLSRATCLLLNTIYFSLYNAVVARARSSVRRSERAHDDLLSSLLPMLNVQPGMTL